MRVSGFRRGVGAVADLVVPRRPRSARSVRHSIPRAIGVIKGIRSPNQTGFVVTRFPPSDVTRIEILDLDFANCVTRFGFP